MALDNLYYYIESPPAAIAVSGGRTSAYMFRRILNAHGGVLPPDVIATFENTGEECEETYQFLHEIETRWHPIVWLEYDDTFRIEDYTLPDGKLSKNRRRRDLHNPTDLGLKVVNFDTAARRGEPYDRMLEYYWKYRAAVKGLGPILPTRVTRMCTSHLKIKIQDRYMRSLGYDYYDSYAGIRYDEPKRWATLAEMNNRAEHYTVVYPMVTDKVTKEMVLDDWASQPFNLALDPQAEEGNCRLCFLKKTDRMIRIIRKLVVQNDGVVPEEVRRWLKREELGGMYFRKDRPPVKDLVQIALSGEEIKPTPDEQEIDCICGSPSV